MSLAIQIKNVSAVYALGGWHHLVPGSLEIDAFELEEILDPEEGSRIYYQLGCMYQENRKVDLPINLPGSIGENWSFVSPQGHHGCRWIDVKTGELVSTSLAEIKAWREKLPLNQKQSKHLTHDQFLLGANLSNG